MKRITVDPTTCLASGLSTRPWENWCQTIEIADQPIAGGRQGEIYPVVHIDGHNATDLLVKIFHEGYPPELREILTTIRNHNATYGIDKCTALRALPLLLFTGTMQGQSAQGSIMRRVSGKPLSQIREDKQDLNAYINLPWADRLALCRQFVEGMHILYSLTIVHADLNGQNLMIDLAQRTLAIIDLDGGAVAGTGHVPQVIGKLEPGWLAPEIIAQLAQTTTHQKITVGMAVDLWATACGMHHLLFGMAPFFFMREQVQIVDYLTKYTWPQLYGLQGITTHNAHIFGYYERAYQQCPASVRHLLEFAFQKGYQNTRHRPTPYQWLQELGTMKVRSGQEPSTGSTASRTATSPSKPDRLIQIKKLLWDGLDPLGLSRR